MLGGPSGSRYETILKLAAGGMATVWVGTVRGALGFRQLVAIKKPHPHLLDDPGFRSELVAEARLASMIHHANVVDVRDVEIDGSEIALVMDYIEGASLGDLLVAASRRGIRLSPRVSVRIALDALAGLHAAHELVDEKDRPVGLVHRDVSPQNILVGTDGTARVADFGVAKFARKNMQSTSEGSLKGKLAYMAPEYLRGESIDRRFDVFAMGVVLWEALSGKRCFRGDNEADTLNRVMHLEPDPVSRVTPEAAALDAVVATALQKNRDERFLNAAAMAAALEATAVAAGLVGGHFEVAKALEELVGAGIQERRALIKKKLANEPSVASLMGVPPIVADAGAGGTGGAGGGAGQEQGAPATVAAATAAAATPKMGGGADVPPTLAAPASPTVTTAKAEMAAAMNATVPATVGVPSTLPMTPRLGGGVHGTIASAATVGVGGTLASAAPLPAPSTPPSRPSAPAHTLRSDVPSSPELRDGAELAFHEASGRSVSGTVAPGAVGVRGSPRWVLPLVVGVVSAAITTGAIVFVTTRAGDDAKGGGATAKPTEAPSASAANASATPTEATSPTPSSTPADIASATSTASSAASATPPTPKPGARPSRPATAPAQPPSATTATAATATATPSAGKKPPPNPYAQ